MEQPDATLERARLLVTARRWEDALKLLAELPEDGEARLLCSEVFARRGDYRRALKEADEAVALLPAVPEPYGYRSDILYLLGRKRESLQAAREAVRLAPQEPFFQIALARSAWAVRDWRLAGQAADAALDLAPDLAEAHAIKGLVEAGRRRRAESREHFEKAVALNPSSAEILNDMAVALPRLAVRNEAVKRLEAAVRLDPSNPLIVDNLYNQASALVRGQGFDPFALVIWVPFASAVILNGVIFFGLLHVPAIAAAVALAFLAVTFVTTLLGEGVRNRINYLRLQPGTRALYKRRFRRDHMLSSAYFVITFLLPAVAIVIVEGAIGLPRWALLVGLVASSAAWAAIGPELWRRRVHPWLIGRR